ncbi:Thymidylate kinase [Peptoniphilus sp. ING2-D1G]|nr:Thymidylate kinase [Peptoniphilus sp. ING2-D1G]
MFIAFEGPDGCGKSTIATAIYEALKDKYDIIKTREPGGTEISEKIRDVILDKNNKNMSARAEALLYAASRAQHVEEKIAPALKEGKIVLCERFVISSLVYQGYGRGLELEDIKDINEFATAGLKPDITFLFITGEKLTYKRKLGEDADRIEMSGLDFHMRVKKGYEELSRAEEYTLIDASMPKEDVLNSCLNILYEKLEVNR